MVELLRRLIGENIELALMLEPQLDVVRIDPGQFEQAIINLAVNARAAMPQGDLKVLYMSGYTENVLADHDMMDNAIAFLQKPFTVDALLQQVRAVLG